jgi:hypothetical protein
MMKLKNLSIYMAKISIYIAIAIALFAVSVSSVTCQETKTSTPPQDWLGAGPIFGLGSYYGGYYPTYNYHAPYYQTMPVASNSFWGYAPLYNYDPYWTYPYAYPYDEEYRTKYHYYPWWVGEHRDLPKALDIARARSSVKIYWNGGWRAP